MMYSITLPLQKGLFGGQVVKSMTMDPEVPVWHHKVTGISCTQPYPTLEFQKKGYLREGFTTVVANNGPEPI